METLSKSNVEEIQERLSKKRRKSSKKLSITGMVESKVSHSPKKEVFQEVHNTRMA